MEDDNASSPYASTFQPSSQAVSVSSDSGSVAMSRTASAPFPGRIWKNNPHSNPRHHARTPTNQMEHL